MRSIVEFIISKSLGGVTKFTFLFILFNLICGTLTELFQDHL